MHAAWLLHLRRTRARRRHFPRCAQRGESGDPHLDGHSRRIGCAAETLRRWVRQAERDGGQRPGLTTDEQKRLKTLERENRELRRANEILRKASAYFTQAELDRRGP